MKIGSLQIKCLFTCLLYDKLKKDSSLNEANYG